MSTDIVPEQTLSQVLLFFPSPKAMLAQGPALVEKALRILGSGALRKFHCLSAASLEFLAQRTKI